MTGLPGGAPLSPTELEIQEAQRLAAKRQSQLGRSAGTAAAATVHRLPGNDNKGPTKPNGHFSAAVATAYAPLNTTAEDVASQHAQAPAAPMTPAPEDRPNPSLHIPNDLSIPQFLRRSAAARIDGASSDTTPGLQLDNHPTTGPAEAEHNARPPQPPLPPQDRPAFATPFHDKAMAAKFLAGLDPNADKFTFQFFADSGNGSPQVLNGTLDDVWPLVLRLNTPQCGAGVYVTINETDQKGRKTENIKRVRALFADADGNEQSSYCLSQLKACGVRPSMVVNSGRGLHIYFLTDDVPLDQFSKLQLQLIAKLGTDDKVKDLPRVLRLPGTLHLKDPTKPLAVTLHNSPVHRWRLPDLLTKLGLSQQEQTSNHSAKGQTNKPNRILFPTDATPHAFHDLPTDESLSDGIKPPPWFETLSPELKDQVVDYACGIIAAKTKYFEIEADGGNNDIWFKLTTAVAVSSAPNAENIFVKHASTAKHADPEDELRAHFARRQASANGRITIGTLLRLAMANGADFEQWKREIPLTAPLPPEKRKPLKGGTYNPAEALELINSHYLIGKSDQDINIFRIKDDGTLKFTAMENFKLDVANIFVKVSPQSVKPAEKFWRESPRRHQRKIVFKPGGTTEPDEFNLWQGFGVEPRRGQQKIVRLMRHIWEVVCRRDMKKFEYLMRWYAWAVQNPDKPAETMPFLMSPKHGTGKSTLGKVMLKIFGKHGALIDDSERLLGRFVDWLEPICFIVAEEILWAGDHRTADKLKSRVTADTIQIEHKKGAIREIPNRLHITAHTNHQHAVAAGVGERRNVVYELSEEHASDANWFDPLYDDLNNGGYEQFLCFLQNLKLGNWHPRRILKTAETTEQQRMSGDNVIQWAQACINADAIVGTTAKFHYMSLRLGQAITSETLRAAYTGFCREQGVRPMNDSNFGKACVEMFGPRKRLSKKDFPWIQTEEDYGLATAADKDFQQRTTNLPPAGSDKSENCRPWGYDVPEGDTWQKKIDARLGI